MRKINQQVKVKLNNCQAHLKKISIIFEQYKIQFSIKNYHQLLIFHILPNRLYDQIGSPNTFYCILSFSQQIIILYRQMNFGQSSQINRQISSSQSCHCKYCLMESQSSKGNKRSTLAFQLNKNRYLPKRRGVPPVKKEGCLKEGSQEPKPIHKKMLQFKGVAPLDNQQKKATPARPKNSDINRMCLTGVFDNYHAVSQSKREKLIRQIKGGRQQGGLGVVPENRPYAMQMEYFGRRRKINSNFDRNLETYIRCQSKQARSKSSYQASPSNPHSQISKHESIRSQSMRVTDQEYQQRGSSLQN